MIADTFSTNGLWMQYFTKHWAFYRFVENAAPSKTAPKTYDFIADKSCLIVILHYSKSFKWIREVIRTQRKCIKSYKNFWGEEERRFVVEKNLTHPKGDFWSYLNHSCGIAVIWDDRMTGNMDRCKIQGNLQFHFLKYWKNTVLC